MIVLDASVLIAHLDADDAHHDRATGLLLGLADESLCMSALTLAEVLAGPARTGSLERAEAAIREIGVVAVPIEAEAATRLAQLRAETQLRMPDCCVLLAAETADACIATFDDRLAAAAQAAGVQLRT